ncbi:RUN domain-containing protein 1-like isoform X2 [Brevipalpus obovatus]|uniref:RUN domain-containing protein 1-like isoform X2 n=1 Tax=Brevipalpus obovatus TaxID=246614 RepID=UPI003D9EC51D
MDYEYKMIDGMDKDPDGEEIESLYSDGREHECSCDTESDDELTFYTDNYDCTEDLYNSRLKKMEEEQDHLNSSLMALTSHFAQVQLRLKQIVEASSEEKEVLLKELEQFAFRGIPDIREPIFVDTNSDNVFENDSNDQSKDSSIVNEESDMNNKLETQRVKQKELIQKLRDQLEELEKYAYDTGQSNSLPSGLLLERQALIIEQLKGKLPLRLDQFDKLTPEELKKQVDNAVKELVNPVIMKEQLVDQLKTQVTDLERFIEFLQVDPPTGRPRGKRGSKCTCNCPLHGNAQKALVKKIDFGSDGGGMSGLLARGHKKFSFRRDRRRTVADGSCQGGTNGTSENRREAMSKIIRRFVTLLQLFTFAQFGCNNFEQNLGKNLNKRFTKGNHWGDIRAKLEVILNKILELNEEKSFNDSDYTSDGEDYPTQLYNEKMNAAIRKEFCPILRDLIEHGLADKLRNSNGTSLIPSYLLGFGCFSDRSSRIEPIKTMTAWDLILKYYEMKNGPQFNSCPARRLSQSFNLEIVGSSPVKPKHSLLSAIDDIIESHTKLRRSPDAHFKAFICEALNQRKLVLWLKLILKNRTLIELFYEDWSYTASTGFDDALASLDKLADIKFKLPSDWAVRQLKSINDAFN